VPLHFAGERGNLNIVSLLVKCGANILARDDMGKNVIDVARDNR
jgi:ankyrin repeat protein